MAHVLIPGRHLVNTRFQERYLLEILHRPPAALKWHRDPPAFEEPIDSIVFAVTSANQQNSRYNPIPFHMRAMGVDRFARSFRESLGISYRIVGVPHFGQSTRFAHITLREIDEQTEGELRLTPQNTCVLCATPEVINMYEELGFSILPAELLADPREAVLPVQVIRRLAEIADDWPRDGWMRQHLALATYSLWTDFPEVPRRVARLWRDPLLTESGSLTTTRDYGTYAAAMSNPQALRFKYDDIAGSIRSGRIVDEGCADGALLVLLASDFPDSDLIGIEITGEFMAQCHERQRQGQYRGTFIHFHQRNLMEEIFQPGSINTTICNSTVHELFSYGAGVQTVRQYLWRKYDQLAPGGRLVIRDVIGPENADRQVLLWCDPSDGDNTPELPDDPAEARACLARQSTRARFAHFARDFLRQSKRNDAVPLRHEQVQRDADTWFALSLRDACEFLLHKDYADNWQSEMLEEFCYWSYAQWKQELAACGFTLLEADAAGRSLSRVYTNPWIAHNRFENRVRLLDATGSPLPWPVTNVVLVAEKALA